MPSRRQLTSGVASSRNNGNDTSDDDLVIFEGDLLVSTDKSRRYKVRSMLGCGTFGQVALCTTDSGTDVACKVIKNQPAYFNQALIEAHILKILNESHDPNGDHHIVRMLDYFVHANHLCIIFERLHANLYEVLKWNHYRGLSLSVVHVIVKQILESLVVLRRAGIIHCDLKPENVLLVNGTSAACRVIDFGSACFEGRTVYSYIQSRFYRSPEVILGHPYNSLIDVWSLGCIAVELFLGLPLFPGSSDYDMLRRIDAYTGPAPADFLARSSFAPRSYVEGVSPALGSRRFRLMTIEEYTECHKAPPSIGKQYFKHLSHLPEHEINLEAVIMQYPAPEGTPVELEAEHTRRQCFLDFLRGVLVIDPLQRWTPWQALQHPFMTGLPSTWPYVPQPEPATALPPVQVASIPQVVPAHKSHLYASGAATPATPSSAATSMHCTAPFIPGLVGALGGPENLLSMSAGGRGCYGLGGPHLDAEMLTIPPPTASLGSSLGTVSMGRTYGSSVSHQSAAVLAMQGHPHGLPAVAADLNNHHSEGAAGPGALEPPAGREHLWPHAMLSRHRPAHILQHHASMQSETGSLGGSFAPERWLGPSPVLGASGVPVLGSAAFVGGASWGTGSFAASMPSHRSGHAPLMHLHSGASTPFAVAQHPPQAHGQRVATGAAASGLARALGSSGRISSGGGASVRSDSGGRAPRRPSIRGGSGRLQRICSGGDLATGVSDSPQTVSVGGGGNDWDPFFPELAEEVTGPAALVAAAAAAGACDGRGACFGGSAFVPLDGSDQPLLQGQEGEAEVVEQQQALSWARDVGPD